VKDLGEARDAARGLRRMTARLARFPYQTAALPGNGKQGWYFRRLRTIRKMKQKITDFFQDENGHWVAKLACGHTQHTRHDPPWQNRPWVTTEEGRAAKIKSGNTMDCKKCDEEVRK
jgi:hypothetical protein